MPKIKFENGTVVNFDGTPTPADVEEVAKSLKIEAPSETESQKSSVLKTLGDASGKALQFGTDIVKGAAKGAVSTLTGTSSLGERGLKSLGRLVTPKNFEESFGFQREESTAAERMVPEALRTPEGVGQNIGFFGEQIAEFLVPTSKIAKLEKGKKLLTRSAIEAGTVGGQTALQQGEFDDEAKTGALIGAAFPVLGAGLKAGKLAFGKGLTKTGEKIQTSVIKPSVKDLKDGFNIKNINKYNLGGTLGESFNKTQSTLNKTSTKLQDALKGSNETVNLWNSFDDTAKALKRSKAKQFGNIRATERILKGLKEEIDSVAGKNGIVDLVDATFVKRGAGTKGAWVFGNADKDANAIEKVYTKFYQTLKGNIEKASPGSIKKINKELSDLIPVQNAILRRIPVDARNNVLSLTDSMGLFASVFDPRALALVGAKKLSTSGRFANVLVKAGQKLKGKPTSALGERFLGGNLKDLEDLPAGMSIKAVGDEAVDLATEAKKFKTAEKLLKGVYGTKANMVDTRGFLAKDGAIIDLFDGQHPTALSQVGLKGSDVDNFTNYGVIRLRNTGITGQQNIQIGAKPTPAQFRELNNLSQKIPVHYDLNVNGKKLSSPSNGVQRDEFLDIVKKAWR